MPSAIEEQLKRHRKQIIDREEQTFAELLDAYREIEKELEKAYARLEKQIVDARAAGETVSPSWLFRKNRLNALLDQVTAQIVRFGGTATRVVTREQRAALTIAVEHVNDDIALTLAQNKDGDADLPDARNFAAQLPPRAIENAVGLMGDGSPLREYFEQQLAPMVAERIKSEVINGVAIGTPFRILAKNLKEAGGITLARAFSVARTEVNRVRRETTRQIYQENDDIFSGWEWVASKSARTCPLCLAMDGKQFPLGEPFPQHVNCRCTMKSIIIGLPAKARTIGRDWFENQPDEIKEQILGKETFAAYKQHDLNLDDFVAFRNDKRFGKSVTRRPLAKILADKPEIEANDKPNLPASSAPSGGDPVSIPSYVRGASPLGKPVGESFKVEIKDERIAPIINLIDSVHGDGELPTLPIRAFKGENKESRVGGYKHKNGKAIELLLDPVAAGDHLDEAMIHEVAHFLDHQVIEEAGKFGSNSGRALAQWRRSIDKTEAVKFLNQLKEYDVIEIIDDDGRSQEQLIEQKRVRYLLKRTELFCRAYTQFVALQSNNQNLLQYIDRIRQNSFYPEFWQDDDFEPIYNFFFDFFAKKQWLQPLRKQ